MQDKCGPDGPKHVFGILKKTFEPIYTNIVGYVAVSGSSGGGMDKLKDEILRVTQRNKQKVPKSYLDVERVVLERFKAGQQSYLLRCLIYPLAYDVANQQA